MTEVSFTMEITLRGLDGTPVHGEREGSAKRKKKNTSRKQLFAGIFPPVTVSLPYLLPADACWVTLSDADSQTEIVLPIKAGKRNPQTSADGT